MRPTNHLNYKSYSGKVEFSEEDAVFYGKVVGIKSLVSFEGKSVATLTEDFRSAIDEYLAFCAENSYEPEKPFEATVLKTT